MYVKITLKNLSFVRFSINKVFHLTQQNLHYAFLLRLVSETQMKFQAAALSAQYIPSLL